MNGIIKSFLYFCIELIKRTHFNFFELKKNNISAYNVAFFVINYHKIL